MNDEFPNGMCIRPVEWTDKKMARVKSDARYYRWKNRLLGKYRRGKNSRAGNVYRKRMKND